jgi:hypothetical protein
MEHKVTFKKIPEFELGKADVEFEVAYAGSKVGTLKISKGSLEWVTDNNSEHRKLIWKSFDELMRKNVAPKP